MDIGSASNNQLLILIAIFFGLALAFAAVIVYAFFGFGRRSENHKKKKQGGVSFTADLSEGTVRKDDMETMNQETEPKKRAGLLKSPPQKMDSSPPTEVAFAPMTSPELNASSSMRQELLRVLLDWESGKIVVEVDGQYYESISQVKERAIGQRILEVIPLLLKFTGGMIATAAGFKTLPVPPATLTSLPPEPPRPVTPAARPEEPAPSLNLSDRLGQAKRSDQSSWIEEAAGLDQEEVQAGAQTRGQESGPRTPGRTPTWSPPLTQPREAPIGNRRGLFGRLLKPEAAPETPGFNLADEIDAILQQKLLAAGERTPVKIDSGPDGRLRINVQGKHFQAIDEVEPAHIKELIQSAVKEWER